MLFIFVLTTGGLVVDGVEKCGEIGGNEGLAGRLLESDADERHKEAQLSWLLFIQMQLFHLFG